jgi:hypothetical protein
MTAVCATALVGSYGGVAWGQEPEDDDVEINIDADDDQVAIDEDDEYATDVDTDTHLMSGFGTSVQVGGGVFGFTSDGADDFMNTGGSWTARLVFGTRMPLALEAAYIGSANDIEALGLDEDAVLLSNGAEANLRWNVLSTLFRTGIDTPIGYMDPYVFSGIGYRRYSLVNEDFNTSSVNDNDNVGEVPIGGGVNWMIGGLAVDLRGEYRLAFDDDLLAAGGRTESTELNTWNASARVGWEF